MKKEGRGCGFYERGKKKAKMMVDILSNFDVLCTTKLKTDISIMETVLNSLVHGSLTFSIHQLHICDTARIGHLHIPQCKMQMQMS
jgi:hypothetical protein